MPGPVWPIVQTRLNHATCDRQNARFARTMADGCRCDGYGRFTGCSGPRPLVRSVYPPRLRRTSLGVVPVQRLNAWRNPTASLKPSVSAMSSVLSVVVLR